METQEKLWKREIKHPSHIDRRGHRRRKQVTTNTSNEEESKPSVGLRRNKSKKVANSTTVSKSRSNSLRNVDSRLTSSLQLCGTGNQVPKAVLPRSQRSSSARERTAQRRPHTSLGFRWNKSSHLHQSLPSSRAPPDPPQCFDLTGYVRRLGTTEGILIGVNGRPVNIRTYLDECIEDSGESCSGDVDEDIDLNYLTSVSEGSLACTHPVPLCWEDQLKMAHPASILSPDCSKKNKKCITVRQQPHTTQDSDIPQTSIMESTKFESIISKTCVTLTWRESCILSSTPLSELNPALRNQFPSQLITNENATNSERCSTMSLTDFNMDIGFSSVPLAEWMEKAKQGEITTPGSSCDIVSDFSSADLLGIWFNTADSAAQKELVKLSFEVFVTATEAVDQNLVEISTKAFKKTSPQKISETVSLIPVHLCEGEPVSDFIRCRELKLTIICDKPRSILFSTRISLLDADQPVPEQTSQLPQTVDDTPCSKAPFKHHLVGRLEVPEHYCNRRNSYCDQELDEDKTDLEGLTRLFPDLMVLEYKDTAAPLTANHTGAHPSKPSSLPVHENELMRLNSISVKIKRNPPPFSLQLETYTNRHRSVNPAASSVENPQGQPLPFALWDPKSDTSSFVTTYGMHDVTKRHLFRPVTPQDIKATHHSNTGYSAIVSSRFMPYMK